MDSSAINRLSDKKDYKKKLLFQAIQTVHVLSIMCEKGEIMLELFILESCPYCQKVIRFFDENDIKYKKMDITNALNHELLMDLGGDNQVPFLYDKDRDVKMYESDDIIDYAKKLD